jgi:hypothetical protein
MKMDLEIKKGAIEVKSEKSYLTSYVCIRCLKSFFPFPLKKLLEMEKCLIYMNDMKTG